MKWAVCWVAGQRQQRSGGARHTNQKQNTNTFSSFFFCFGNWQPKITKETGRHSAHNSVVTHSFEYWTGHAQPTNEPLISLFKKVAALLFIGQQSNRHENQSFRHKTKKFFRPPECIFCVLTKNVEILRILPKKFICIMAANEPLN